MKTYKYFVPYLLVTLLFGVSACGLNNPDEGDQDICTDPAFANIENDSYYINAPNGLFAGDIMNYDPEFRFLAFGEHAGASEGPDNEKLMGVTMFFHAPRNVRFTDLQDKPKKCVSKIQSATLSTTDARIGTAEEINGKLYKLAEGNGDTEPCIESDVNGEFILELKSNNIEFFYVSSRSARGWFCAKMQQVSPESGEPFLFSGFFEIKI